MYDFIEKRYNALERISSVGGGDCVKSSWYVADFPNFLHLNFTSIIPDGWHVFVIFFSIKSALHLNVSKKLFPKRFGKSAWQIKNHVVETNKKRTKNGKKLWTSCVASTVIIISLILKKRERRGRNRNVWIKSYTSLVHIISDAVVVIVVEITWLVNVCWLASDNLVRETSL